MLNLVKSFVFLFLCSIVFFVLVEVFVIKNNDFTPQQVYSFDWEKEVDVYFGNRKMGDQNDCREVFPVKRIIPNAENLSPGALISLIYGPYDYEKEEGYFSGITNNPSLAKFEVLDRIAYIDFGQEFKNNLTNDCRTDFVYSQIENTLTAFPYIDRVVVLIEGEIMEN